MKLLPIIKKIIILSVFFMFYSCAFLTKQPLAPRLLEYQVMFPDRITPDKKYTFHWVFDSHISSHTLVNQMIVSDNITSDQIPIEKGFNGQFLVEFNDHHSEVFDIDIPYNPETGDWSEWMQPDFISKTKGAYFALFYGQKINKDNDSLQKTVKLRFRIIRDERVNKELCECMKKRKQQRDNQ